MDLVGVAVSVTFFLRSKLALQFRPVPHTIPGGELSTLPGPDRVTRTTPCVAWSLKRAALVVSAPDITSMHVPAAPTHDPDHLWRTDSSATSLTVEPFWKDRVHAVTHSDPFTRTDPPMMLPVTSTLSFEVPLGIELRLKVAAIERGALASTPQVEETPQPGAPVHFTNSEPAAAVARSVTTPRVRTVIHAVWTGSPPQAIRFGTSLRTRPRPLTVSRISFTSGSTPAGPRSALGDEGPAGTSNPPTRATATAIHFGAGVLLTTAPR